MTAFLSQIHYFLFPKRSHPQLGLFRIILCGTLFYLACWRQLNLDQLGVFALIPRDQALQIFPEFYRPLVQWFFWPDQFVFYAHLSLVILLGLATLGYSNRFFLMITWVLHQGVLNRNYAINFGADSIGGLFLFYLCFTRACEFYTLKEKTKMMSDDLTSVFFRLIQIQLGIIYMYTGFEKLKGSTWWDGTALWTILANPQFTPYDLKFLSSFPWMIALATFTTVAFEVYFPAAVVHPQGRKFILPLGVFFHLSIGLLLGLMPFSLIMLSAYALFISPEKFQRFFQFFREKLYHFKTPKF